MLSSIKAPSIWRGLRHIQSQPVLSSQGTKNGIPNWNEPRYRPAHRRELCVRMVAATQLTCSRFLYIIWADHRPSIDSVLSIISITTTTTQQHHNSLSNTLSHILTFSAPFPASN